MKSRFMPMPIERNFAQPGLPRQAGKNFNACGNGTFIDCTSTEYLHYYEKHPVLIKTDTRRSALRFLPYGKSEDATPIPCIYDRLIGKWRGRLRSGSLQRSTE